MKRNKTATFEQLFHLDWSRVFLKRRTKILIDFMKISVVEVID